MIQKNNKKKKFSCQLQFTKTCKDVNINKLFRYDDESIILIVKLDFLYMMLLFKFIYQTVCVSVSYILDIISVYIFTQCLASVSMHSYQQY